MSHQQTTLVILFILLCVSFFGCNMAKKENNRTLYSGLSLAIGIMSLFLVFMLLEVNRELEKKRGKCPDYEKIENAYRLKK